MPQTNCIMASKPSSNHIWHRRPWVHQHILLLVLALMCLTAIALRWGILPTSVNASTGREWHTVTMIYFDSGFLAPRFRAPGCTPTQHQAEPVLSPGLTFLQTSSSSG